MTTLPICEYGDLYHTYGWRQGVHRAPVGYQHPWLVVFEYGAAGYWSRAEARDAWHVFRAALADGAKEGEG